MIRRARRRQLENLLVRQLADAVCAVTGVLVLLLLTGTDILDWPWMAGLAAASAAFLVLRTLRHGLPSSYRTAQAIDTRLKLDDTLSTAFYFQQPECRRFARDDFKAGQLAEAERLAREADLDRAVPFARPKSLYAMAGLLLAASSLFALRYGFTRTLDLHPPLAAILFDAFHLSANQRLVAERKPEPLRLDEELNKYGQSLDSEAGRAAREPASPGPSPEAAQSQRAGRSAAPSRSERGGTRSTKATSSRRRGQENGQPGEATVEQQSAGRNATRAAGAAGEPGGSSAAGKAGDSGHESNSLLDRFKDAMSNLLSRFQSQPDGSQSGQQLAQGSQGRPDSGQRSGDAAQNQQIAGQPQGGQQPGERQGQDGQRAQSGKGPQAGAESPQPSRPGPSGIGKQDGNKDIRAARQMEAMGKISQILGRRSREMTGEAMVEVASGRQRLRTPYTNEKATHRDAGGEIHRDEIPLAYQAFVERYFDQVRKK